MSRVNVDEMMFVEPEPRISTIFRVHPFTFTEGYGDLTFFIREMNAAVVGVKAGDPVFITDNVSSLLGLLEVLKKFADELPPETVSEEDRRPDPAFRKWHSLLVEESYTLLLSLLPPELHSVMLELSAPFHDSFGCPEEIEYGVGNEAAFLIFLMCLYRVGFLDVVDQQAVVLRIFNRYLKLCRFLQKRYRMKPALTSQFAIDEFQFVPYIWGSAQLIGNPLNLEPESYANRATVKKFSKDYLLFDAVKFIFQMKKGKFHEHSPELWNITAIHSWERLNKGLFRMYEAEVLQKFPIVCRFRFGSLFSFERRKDAPQEAVYPADEDSDVNE